MLDYFPGYEAMVVVLAWMIYVGIPVSAVWVVRQCSPNPKSLLVSPVIALASFFVFRTFFILISSKNAGIENIFIWYYHLFFSAALLLLYWLSTKKAALNKHIRLLQFVSYISSFCFGICVRLGTLMLLYTTVFSLDGLGGIRTPHQIAAGWFVLTLVPTAYLGLLYGIRWIQPKVYNVKSKWICVALVVLGWLACWLPGRL